MGLRCAALPQRLTCRAVRGQTILQHNTLFKNPEEQDPTEIEVIDPTHPLFGRHFPVISVSSPLHGSGHVLVRYREYMSLRVPVDATTLGLSRPLSSTKLTVAAVQELVTITEDCEALHALCTQSDLETPPPNTATSDQRRTLHHPAGGPL